MIKSNGSNGSKQPPAKRSNSVLNSSDDTVSNSDLYNFMAEMRAESKEKLESINNDLSTKISSLQSSISNIEENIGTMKLKIDENSSKVDESLKLANQNKAAINMLYQNKLQNKLEIVGTDICSTLQGNELLTKVNELIESFGIEIDDSDIKNAFQRPNKKSGASIVTVEFKDLGTKLRILKERKKVPSDRKIYFDNCLTPLNRFLMHRAREISKEKNFRVFLAGDQIHVKKDDQTKRVINDVSDIEIVKGWLSNQRVAVTKNKAPTVPSDASTSNNAQA
jgi:hypothetical protein